MNFYGSSQIEWDHPSFLESTSKVITEQSDLWFHKAERHTESQDGKLDQSGLLGEITFSGAQIGPLLPLIVAGEFLHAGKGTAFGFGCYRIVD